MEKAMAIKEDDLLVEASGSKDLTLLRIHHKPTGISVSGRSANALKLREELLERLESRVSSVPPKPGVISKVLGMERRRTPPPPRIGREEIAGIVREIVPQVVAEQVPGHIERFVTKPADVEKVAKKAVNERTAQVLGDVKGLLEETRGSLDSLSGTIAKVVDEKVSTMLSSMSAASGGPPEEPAGVEIDVDQLRTLVREAVDDSMEDVLREIRAMVGFDEEPPEEELPEVESVETPEHRPGLFRRYLIWRRAKIAATKARRAQRREARAVRRQEREEQRLLAREEKANRKEVARLAREERKREKAAARTAKKEERAAAKAARKMEKAQRKGK